MDDDLIFLEPRSDFDGAIVGTLLDPDRICYNMEGVIETLIVSQGFDREEALEWFYFNILGSHLGDHTPTYIILKDQE